MKRISILLAVFASAYAANASWYWPFTADDGDKPRLSELMEPASLLIDEATDLVNDGKLQEAISKYREALDELQQVELDNPDRAATTEFASLRNKRAYVNAAIDTLLLSEARNNAKAVAITDTTELEKKFLRKRGKLPPEEPETVKPAPESADAEPKVADAEPKAADAEPKTADAQPEAEKPKTEKSAPARPGSEKLAAALKKDPKNRRLRLALIGEQIRESRLDQAMEGIGSLLRVNMSDASALNLKAVCEASKGDFKAAEKTLDFAIQSHPRDHHGYYNMASLKLQVGNPTQARYYYETGRAVGGPKDAELEAAIAE